MCSRKRHFPLDDVSLDFYGRASWMEWWEEFTSELNNCGTCVRYITVDQFCKAKTRNPNDAALLSRMIGPSVSSDLEAFAMKKGLGWIYNWEARRHTLWRSAAFIRETVRRSKQEDLLQLWERLRQHAETQLTGLTVLGMQIDAEYCGQPFLPFLAPTAPRNLLRFNSYMRHLRMKMNLLWDLVEIYAKLVVIAAAVSGQLPAGFAGAALDQEVIGIAQEIARAQNHQ